MYNSVIPAILYKKEEKKGDAYGKEKFIPVLEQIFLEYMLHTMFLRNNSWNNPYHTVDIVVLEYIPQVDNLHKWVL